MLTRRWWFLLAATLAFSALTARLGVWQLGRATQKETIYAQQQSQLQLPPLNAAELLVSASSGQALYRRLDVQGHWIASDTVYLANRSLRGQSGFLVLTPLRLHDQTSILVIRGWAPRDWVDSNRLPIIETPLDEVRVQGIWTAAPSHMLELAPMPQESLSRTRFQSLRQNIELDAYARETGLNIVAVLQEAGEPSQGLIREAPSILSGADRNKAYALQWFAMSLVCAGLFVWFQIIQKIRHG